MTDAEIKAMIERLIQREGGYVDHPNDAGGCTNMGITLATLEAHRNRATTCADVRALHIAEATAIYRKFWFDHDRLRLSQWPYRKLAEVTLDAAVMFSLGREMTVKWVQSGINALRPAAGPLKVDGWAGPSTLAAMVMCDQHKLVSYVIAERCRKHARVVKANPSQAAFIEGWTNRATAWLMVANGGEAGKPVEWKDAPAVVPDFERFPWTGGPGGGPMVDDSPQSPTPYVLARDRGNRPAYWTGAVAVGGGMELPVVSYKPEQALTFASQAEAETGKLEWPGLRHDFEAVAL